MRDLPRCSRPRRSRARLVARSLGLFARSSAKKVWGPRAAVRCECLRVAILLRKRKRYRQGPAVHLGPTCSGQCRRDGERVGGERGPFGRSGQAPSIDDGGQVPPVGGRKQASHEVTDHQRYGPSNQAITVPGVKAAVTPARLLLITAPGPPPFTLKTYPSTQQTFTIAFSKISFGPP